MAATSRSPSFAYPTGKPTFNYKDEVIITYTTPWAAGVNLTVYCQDTFSTPQSTDYYQTYLNPLQQNSTYMIEEIGNPDDLTGVLEWPTLCWFKLENIAGHHETALGGNFTMASTAGPKSTWGLAVASTAGSGLQTTSLSSPTSTSVPGTGQASPTSSSHSAITTGAKAGIGAGAAIAALLIIVLATVIHWQRRKLARKNASLARFPAIHEEQASAERTKPALTKVELFASTAEVRPIYETAGKPVQGNLTGQEQSRP